MKLSSLFFTGTLVAALAFAVSAAKADGLPPGDPIVKAAGAGFDAPAGIVSTSFSILSPSGTSPETSDCFLLQGNLDPNDSPNCQFENDITIRGQGQVIDTLIFDLPGVPNDSNLNCSPMIDGDVQIFTTCSKVSDGSGGTAIFFTGGSIAWHDIFTLDFEGFPAGFTSSAVAELPEPGVLMMLLIGLVALVGFGLKRSAVRA